MIGSDNATCPACSGTGWVQIDDAHVGPCTCREGLRRDQRMVSASIPKRYLHCSLSGFHDRGSAVLGRARRSVTDFVDCWPMTTDSKGLLLMGACGSGKTHLAVALLLEIIRSSKPGRVLFSNFQDLIQKIHGTFDNDEGPSRAELLRPLVEADLLVLDELGSQKPTAFVQDILYYVINSRYNEERVTVFTTNYLDDPRDGEESLEDRIGRRLRSRLYEMTDPVVLAGVDDYRMSKARGTI